MKNNEKRTLANRLSARKSRARKKQYIQDLESTVNKLTKKGSGKYNVTTLLKQISILTTELQEFRSKNKELENKIVELEELNKWSLSNDFLKF